MKSNYMKSAEIKIAKNPEWGELYRRMLIADAQVKELNLRRALGTANTVYIPEHECTPIRGHRAQIYLYDDWAHDLSAYKPIFIGTRNGLDATLDAYRIWQTPTTAWEPYRNDTIAQIRFED